MKKLLIYISLFFLLFSGALAQEQQKQPQVPDDKLHKEQFKLDGAWLPDHDPAEIGPSNFSVFKNMRYGPVHPRMVDGYTVINSTPLSTYDEIRSGHQLRSDRTQKTYVLVNADNGSGSSRVYQNQTAIPNQGNFESTELHTDAAGAGLGRWSDAPQGNIAYANEKESYIWGGEEIRVAGFFLVDGSLGSEVIEDIEARDFSSTSNWNNSVGDPVNEYNETGDLSIAADAAGQYCGIVGPGNIPLTAGVMYRIEFDVANVVNGWTLSDYLANNPIGTITSTGVGHYELFYVPTVTGGGIRITATTSSSSADFDNFTIKEVTLDLDTPIDYTEQANSTLETSGNVIPIPTGTRKFWIIFTTRPAQAIHYSISDYDTNASTTTCAVWTGSSFNLVANPSDGTESAGRSMYQDGSYTFDSTVADAKPFHLEGVFLYAYLFAMTDGEPTISHVSVDAPWQPVVDVWDGVLRQPIQFQVESAGDFEDYTLAVNYESDIDIPIGGILDGLLSTDNIVVMFSDRMAGIRFQMLAGLVNANAASVTVKYNTGLAWATVGVSIRDETDNAGDTIGKTGLISWSPPDIEDEHPVTLFGVTGYAYQLTFDATLSGAKGDVEEILVDLVTGIPAQKTVKPFKFPSVYKNRLLLCNYTEGKEANRVDYSSSNAPDVFNGLDSSMGGLQSLYFGNSDALTAGTQLYNRYGSNVFAIWLALKETSTYILTGDTPEDFKIFPVSFTIGCPAPLTLATAEVGFEAVQGIQRNIAFWLAHSGPVMFNGSEVFPIPGINKYFDPADPDCINFEYIDVARGWYDTTYREYNILIPSGSSQTTNNVWLVYDLIRKKWFEKDTGSQEVPQAAIQVVDTEGNKYVYGGVDDGYLIRFEDGTSWAGTAIDAVLTTGDFRPSKNIWDKTILRQIKIVAKATTPDLDVVHYPDTATSGTTIINNESLDASGYRLARITAPLNITAWSHRFSFQLSSASVENPFEPIVWGLQWQYVRDDL